MHLKHVIATISIACICASALAGCATTNTAANSSEIQSSANNNAIERPVEQTDAYIWSKMTEHSNKDKSIITTTRSFEDDGRLVQVDINDNYITSSWNYSNFTEDGYPQTESSSSPDKHSSYSYADNVLTKTSDFGHTTETTNYEYFDNGRIKSITYAKTDSISSTAWQEDYDKNGYLISKTKSHTLTSAGMCETEKSNYEWAFNGKTPITCIKTSHVTTTIHDETTDDETTETKYNIVCDNHGNITQFANVTNGDVIDIEYQHIQHPYLAAIDDSNMMYALSH